MIFESVWENPNSISDITSIDLSSNSTITANTGFVGKLQTEEQPNVTTMTGLQHIGTNVTILQGVTIGKQSLVGAEGFIKILSTSDYLILLLPLTEKTKTIINSESLKLVKTGAILINAGRGGLIEDNDLLKALDNGKLSGCTLDVFNEEPLPPEHPFWSHDKVTVTPHISAPTRLRSSIKSILINVDRIKKGLKPFGLVEKERFY